MTVLAIANALIRYLLLNEIPLGALGNLTGRGRCGVANIATLDSGVPVDPNSGTGGVIIVSENGVPVPEPLLATGMGVFGW